MEEYGKIFRCKRNNSFILRPYNPDIETYFELIKSARANGYNQLIVNSEIMINLMYEIVYNDGLLLKITMSDNTDQDIKDNIKFILTKLRQNKILFTKLKEELEWAVDSGSIDVDSIDILFENRRYTILSNGIIFGEDIHYFFNKVITSVLGSYFDE